MFEPFVNQLLLGGTFAGAIGLLAFYKKWLTGYGALLATAMGILVWVSSGFKTSAPMLFFFLTSSLISQLPKHNLANQNTNKAARNATQVFCNGGVASLLLLIGFWQQQPIWLAAYLLSLSCSMADTWSSEWGRFFGGKVVDIKNGKPMQAGLSGGISWQGTLAGLLGAACMAAFSIPIFKGEIKTFGFILLGGFAGMLFDSLLGSLLQAKYLQHNGVWCEKQSNKKHAKPQKGFAWMNNDLVNLVANIITTAAGVWLYWNIL